MLDLAVFWDIEIIHSVGRAITFMHCRGRYFYLKKGERLRKWSCNQYKKQGKLSYSQLSLSIWCHIFPFFFHFRPSESAEMKLVVLTYGLQCTSWLRKHARTASMAQQQNWPTFRWWQPGFQLQRIIKPKTRKNTKKGRNTRINSCSLGQFSRNILSEIL